MFLFRRLAILALVSLPGFTEEPTEEDIEHLMFDLEEADSSERDSMVRALARTMSPKAAPALLTVLASINEEDLPPTLDLAERHACRLADSQVIATCRDMLQSKDAAVRRYAAHVLPFAGTPEAHALLQKTAEDPELRVRTAAIEGLGYTKDPALLPVLQNLSRSPDSSTAAAAQVAIRTLQWQTGQRPREDFSVRVWPMRSIVLVGENAFWAAWFGSARLHCRLNVQSFTAANLHTGFEEALPKTRLVIVSQIGDDARRTLFRQERYRQALKEFLKRGGTLVLDGGIPGPEAEPFLAELEISLPRAPKNDPYSAVPSLEEVHSLTAWPFRLDQESAGLDGSIGWQTWEKTQGAPYRSQASQSLAAMVVQENVLGAGRVIFNGVTGMWDTNRKHCDMVENLLATTFDSPDRTLYYFFRLRHDFRLPAWEFARPWAGPKLKVLFIGDSYFKRDIVELCQRTDLLDYEYACLVERREGPYERHSNALEGASVVDIQQKIAGEYDVFVVARRGRATMRKHWELLPEDIRRMIVRRVLHGAGLIVLGSGSGLEKEGKPDRELAELRDLQPLEDDLAFTEGALPYETGERRRGRLDASILNLRRAGQGRIVLIDDFPKPGPEFASPGLAGPFTRFRHHDYTYSLFLRTLLWAGRKQPEIEVVSIRPAAGAPAARVALKLRNKAPQGNKIIASLNVINRSNEVRATGEEILSLEAGEEKEITISMPEGLPPGLLVARASLRQPDGRAVNWAAAAMRLDSPEDIENVEFDRPAYAPGETLKAAVKFKSTLQPPGARLLAQLVDTYGRQMAQTEIELPPGLAQAEIQLPVGEPVALMADLCLKLTRPPACLAEEKFPIAFRLPRKDREDFKWYVWRSAGRGEERLATVQLGVDTAHGSPNDSENSLRYNGAVAAFSFDSAGPPGGSEGLARRPCFQNASYHYQLRTRVKEAASSFFMKCGVRDIMLGDEQTIGGTFCFCPSCRFHFREWAKNYYGSLDRLNLEWGAKFRDWEEVRGQTLEEVKDPGHPGAWMDHRRYMDSVFSARVRRYRETIQAYNPDAVVGLSGTQKDSPFTNYDWWELSHAGNFWLAYGGVQTKLRRSFRTSETIMAQWGGGYGRMDNNEVGTRQTLWSLLFNRYDAFAYYWGGSDAFIMLEADLTPINKAVWTAEEVRQIKRGIGKMLLRSQLDTFGIGMHYSPASHYSTHVTARLQANRPDFTDNLLSLGMPMEDLRLQFTYVAYQEVELGELIRRQFKILLLPNSQAVSAREAEEIRKFVEAGGTLVADFAAGQRNEHGRWQTPGLLDDVFGVSLGKPAAVFQKASLELVKEFGSLKPGGGTWGEFLAPFDEELTPTSAVAHGLLRSGDNVAPALLVNSFGNGKTVYLNFSLAGYGSLRTAGSGGELSEVERLKAEQGSKVRELVSTILDHARVTRGFDWRPGDARTDLSQVFVYHNGPLSYVGVIPGTYQPDPVDVQKRDDYHFQLPQKANIYDCRNGQWIAEDQSVRVHPVTGMASLYAVLPYRVESIRPGSGSFVPGQQVSLTLEVATAGGPKAGEHILHVDVRDASGRLREEYRRNLVASEGKASMSFPLGLNDPEGEWEILAQDAATGVQTTGKFHVRKVTP